MADHTINYSLPFPEGSDDVAVHSDIAELARAADHRVNAHILEQSNRISSAEDNLGTLNEEVGHLEDTYLPRSDAAQYGIKGPKGDKGDVGDQGKQGIPGVEAVPADEAVAAYLSGDETHTRNAADAMYPSRSEFTPIKNLAEHATLRNADETVEGSWTFTKGHIGGNAPISVGVHRKFDATQGDLFTSDVRLEMRVSSQASTNQNPPGYNIASLVMVENGEHGEQYQGESAKIDFVSNRFRMNKRLEIMMGDGSGRATLSSGAYRGYQFARLSLHNASHPRLDLYGPDNESHNNTRKNLMLLDGARLDIRSSGSVAQRWENESSEGKTQRLEVAQFGQGHQSIRGFYDGENVGQIQWYPEDMSVRISATNRVVLQSHVYVTADLEHSSGRGPILRSPNGQKFKIRVNNNGTLSTESV